MKNEMEICFDAFAENEGFARVAVSAFVANRNPTLEEMSDIKTAVSEAVTNAIIHGYDNPEGYRGAMKNVPREERLHVGKVRIKCSIESDFLNVEVKDEGKGIVDVEKAMEPLYTTRPEWNRSGMGFAFMEAFMDDLEVDSTPGKGTCVRMRKRIGCGNWIQYED